ncbi:MAG TPA: carboxypeptidase-like regulatory domain-containing protein [Planctomycetota bacterium]
MNRRPLAAAAVLLLALAVWLVARGIGAPQVEGAEDRAPPAAEALLEAVAFAGDAPLEIGPMERTRIEAAPTVAAPIPVAAELGGAAPAANAPVTRVLVRAFGVDLPAATKQDFLKGQEVTVQCWLEATEATRRYTQELDEQGETKFRFQGDVHVDWALLVPPVESGLGVAILEEHADVPAGGLYEMRLATSPAAALFGTVRDLDGRPVAGATVHAYRNEWMSSDLEPPWTPGVLQTRSDAQGNFRFDNLMEDTWGVAVEPKGWLQIAPDIESSEVGEAVLELVAGAPAGPADLRVLPAPNFRVTARDAAGAPLARVWVRLEPVAFEHPMVRGRHSADEVPGAVDWPYDALDAPTDESGVAEMFAIAGTWNLQVRLGGLYDDVVPALSLPIVVPCGNLEVQLPFVPQRFAGRIRLEGRDAPVPYAGVALRWETTDRPYSQDVQTDQDGRFVFENVPPDGAFELFVHGSDVIPRSRTVALRPDDEERDFLVRPAARLHVQLVDKDGNPVRRGSLRLLEGKPDGGFVAAPGEASWFEFAKQTSGRPVNRRGDWTARGLAPGDYTIGFTSVRYLVNATQAIVSGSPTVHERWTLHTGPSVHVLVLDPVPSDETAVENDVEHLATAVDLSTGEALAGVEVIYDVPGVQFATASDATGGFRIPGAPPQGFRLTLRAPGFLQLDSGLLICPSTPHEHIFQLVPQ